MKKNKKNPVHRLKSIAMVKITRQGMLFRRKKKIIKKWKGSIRLDFSKRLFLRLRKLNPLIIVVLVLIFGVASIALRSKILFADSATYTLNTQEAWEAGEFWPGQIDFTSTADSIQIKAGSVGSFSTNTPGFPWNRRGYEIDSRSYNAGYTGTAYHDGATYGADIVTDGAYLYMTLGGRQPDLYRYNPELGTWKQLADAPTGFLYGGSLAYYEGYIYAINGQDGDDATDAKKDFFRYDVAGDSWERLADAPDTWGLGSDIVSGENGKIYAVQGRAFDKFWSYNIATGTWKDNENSIPSPYQIYSQNGHALEYSSVSWGADPVYCEQGCIYAFQGNNNVRFFRYDIKDGTWVQAATVDTDLGTLGRINYGSAMAFNPDTGNIFATTGGSNDEFMQYDPDDNVWDADATVTPDMNVTVNEGGSMVYLDGFVYVLPGINRPEMLKYDVTEGKWDSITVTADASSTYDGNEMVFIPSGVDCADATGCLFMMLGDTSVNFYRYDIAEKEWNTLTALSTTPTDYRPQIGSSLCYDGDDNIYYVRGRNTNVVGNYDISAGTWASIGSIPGNPEEGAGITCLANDEFYILQGNGTRNVYHYNAGWTTETIPDMPATNAAFYGGAITDNGDDVFVMPGNWRGNFYRYDPDSDTWSTLKDFPAASYYSTVLEYDGVDNIYAITSHYNKSFYRYDISEDEWSKISDLPAEFLRSQAMAHDDANDLMYVRRGGDTFAIYEFSTETDEYIPSATWISDAIDLTYATQFNGFTPSATIPGATSIDYYTRTSDDQVSWTAWDEIEQVDWNIDSAVARYIQVKVVLNSDNTSSPTLTSFSVNYEKDSSDPTNPSVDAYSDEAKTAELTDTENYYYVNPYFEFSGGSDAESGLAGYYVLWTDDANDDPDASEDYFQTSDSYVVTVDGNGNQISAGTYYLRIAAKDQAGNVANPETVFTYVYDGISPSLSVDWIDDSDFEQAGTSESNINTQADTGESMKLDSVANGVWTHEAPTPLQLSATTANDGSTVAYDGNDTLFILRGNNSQNLWAYSISNKTYDETHTAYGTVNVIRGASMVFVPDNISAGCTDNSGCLFATAGNGTTFKRYDISAKAWTTLTAVPQTVSYGGSIAYDGNDTLYVTTGNSQYYAMKYTISTGQWSDPAVPDMDQTVSYGHTLAFVPNGDDCTAAGGCLFATRGLNDNDFYKYEVGGSWSYGNNVPLWTSYGATSYYLDGYIYLLRGHISNDFLRYDIANNNWEYLADLPTSKYLGSSNSMFYVESTDTLYVLRGEAEYSLLAYDVSENRWRTQALPTGVNRTGFYYGATAFYDDAEDDKDTLFVARGLNTPDFYAYYPESETWEKRASVPHYLRFGADSEYVDHVDDALDGVYLVSGDETLGEGFPYFYRYNPHTDLWTRLNHQTGGAVNIADLGYGSDLVFDGSDTIYLITGNNTRTFYSYDITSDVWTQIGTATNLPAAAYQGSCAVHATVGSDNYVYFIQSNNTRNIYRFNTDAGDNPTFTWETMALADANLRYGDACVLDGQGNILVPRGNDTDEMYVYNLVGDSWTTRSVLQYYEYGSLVMTDNNIILGFRGESTSALERYVLSTATTGFEANGSWTSQVIDFTAGVFGYGSLSIESTIADDTSLAVETRTCDDSVCTTPGEWTSVANGRSIGATSYYTVESAVSRYGQVRVTFVSDQVYTPTVNGLSWSYFADTTAPNNPGSSSAYTDSGMGTGIINDTWTNDATPYFTWNGSDNSGGIGVEGYYVYFGNDNTKDPITHADDPTNLAYVSGTNFYPVAANGTTGSWNAATQAAGALISDEYYLIVRTKDRNNNQAASSGTLFTYKLDSIVPSRPSSVSVTPPSWTSTNSFNFTWPAATDTGGSGILEYCYYVNDVYVDCTANAFANGVTASQTRENTFCVYATDNANNTSSSCREKTFYYAGDAPSAPQNIVIDPATTELAPQEDVNSFTITWDLPSTCLGSGAGDCDSADILRYCYTINELPTAETCGANIAGSATPSPDGGWTTTTQTSSRSLLSFSAATQQGENTIYFVAADAINNIDYDNYAEENFYFSSNAPGIPSSAAATDTSDRATQKYSVVLTWDEPSDVGSGVEGYKIYRCESDCENPSTVDDPPANYTRIATVDPLGYLDTSLDTDITYSYLVRSEGTGGTQSGNSSVMEIKPEGKFKFAPLMSGQPSVVAYIRSAVVEWLTLDDADQYGNIVPHPASSYVEYGATTAYGNEAGTPDLVNEHEVTLSNLEPDTTYHYRVRWEDQDGNTGYSSDFTFVTKGAPSAPINLDATPDSNTINSFSFSWSAPTDEGVTIGGYYYSINSLPNDSNTTYTTETEIGPIDAATQQGTNTFYVVASDDSDNKNFENYAAVEFDANTAPPGSPQAVTITDSSDRDAERFSITITWDPPEGYDLDDEIYYTIYRATSDYEATGFKQALSAEDYEEIATITSTGYLDTGLDNTKQYYYQVLAKDKAQATSDMTATVSEVPEGRYTQPPAITEAPSVAPDSYAATLTWRTERIASSFIEFGLSSDLGEEQGTADLIESHEVTVTGLKPQTTYYYRVKSIDIDENAAYSQVASFTTLEAPRVLNVEITDVRLFDATVTWQTNKETTAVIQYGTTTDYGLTLTDVSGGFALEHTLKLQNLEDGSVYHLRLEGLDRSGNPIASDDYQFTTLTFPEVTDITTQNKAEGQTEIHWKSNVPTTSIVEYYAENVSPKTQGNTVLTTDHAILLFGLEDATRYTFNVRGSDEFGYEAVSDDKEFVTLEDTTAPQIFGVKSESNTIGSGEASKVQIVVSWKTNEATTSQIEYGVGLGSDNFTDQTEESAELVLDHLVVVSDLQPAKTYFFRVVSRDKAGNITKSSSYTVLTSRQRESFLQLIISNLEQTFSWLGNIGSVF